MKPLRRNNTTHLTTDPVTGKDRILDWQQNEHILYDGGLVDSANVLRKYFRDCGCDAETGGQCFECGAISCKTCHGRCQACHKPICLQHSRFLHAEEGQVRLCGSCCDRISRKQTRAKIGRFFLSFLVKQEDGRDG